MLQDRSKGNINEKGRKQECLIEVKYRRDEEIQNKVKMLNARSKQEDRCSACKFNTDFMYF